MHRIFTRSRRLRFSNLLVVVLALVGLLITGSSAQAGKGWCRVDPIVIIDGQITDIFVGSDLSALLSTTGPIKITVTIPPDTQAVKLISDLGFGRGYDFKIVVADDLEKSENHTPVIISVYVPAKQDSLPVSVYFSPRLSGILTPVSADGNANQWVTLYGGV